MTQIKDEFWIEIMKKNISEAKLNAISKVD